MTETGAHKAMFCRTRDFPGRWVVRGRVVLGPAATPLCMNPDV